MAPNSIEPKSTSLFITGNRDDAGLRLCDDHGNVLDETPIQRGCGDRKEVVILGAGIGGLTLAYLLLKSRTGYKVTILEAAEKVGGRSLTLRNGDKVVEIIATKSVEQDVKLCEDDHNPDDPKSYRPYLNAGPGRIPSGHVNVINLCRELEVELETYIMETRSNLQYSKNKKVYPNRHIATDVRGYFAEYIYNQVNKDDFEIGGKKLEAEEKCLLRQLLVTFGHLTDQRELSERKEYEGPRKGWPADTAEPNFKYEGSNRAGYVLLPGVNTSGEHRKPIEFAELLDSEFWRTNFYQPDDWLWQASSFQPVGGMDMIGEALKKAINGDANGRIVTGVEVTSAVAESNGKWTVCTKDKKLACDICVSNIPIPLLKKNRIVNPDDFSPGYKNALTEVMNTDKFFKPLAKVGWQAKRKLWQQGSRSPLPGEDPTANDPVPIIGGISYTHESMSQMWYPSDKIHDEWGVLTGAYNAREVAADWGTMMPKDRCELARSQAGNIHGAEFSRQLQNGVAVAWQNVPHHCGGYSDWREVGKKGDEEDSDLATTYYNTLLKGDKNFYIVGDQVSHLPGWKEGAVLSALNVLAQIANVKDYKMTIATSLPDADALVLGEYACEDK